MNRFGTMAAMGLAIFLTVTTGCSEPTWPRSPDGKFESRRLGAKPDVHYQVVELTSGKVLMTTQAAYSAPNDVKAGVFSRDSRYIAAVYHYGHRGPETWIGVWEIRSGKQVRCQWRPYKFRVLPADEAKPGECRKR